MELLTKIKKMIDKKIMDYGIMGNEVATIIINVTDLEKNDFYVNALPILEQEHANVYWEYNGNELTISCTRD